MLILYLKINKYEVKSLSCLLFYKIFNISVFMYLMIIIKQVLRAISKKFDGILPILEFFRVLVT